MAIVKAQEIRIPPVAFDIYVFDLFAAPRDRYDFVDWISRTFRHVDGPGGDASRTTPALQAWQREMAVTFPGSVGDVLSLDIDMVLQQNPIQWTTSMEAAAFM